MDAELANAIAREMAKSPRKHWLTPTVVTVDDAHTCTVETPTGERIPNVHWLDRGDAYIPTEGSVVFAIGGGRQLFILGNFS